MTHARVDEPLPELFARVHEHGDERAREVVALRFLPLAHRLARRYQGASEPLGDLVQVASVGLLTAIDRYDPDRGLAFGSFAIPTILGELCRYFRDRGWSAQVPRGAQERALWVDQAAKRLGGHPTPRSLAEHLQWSPDDVRRAGAMRAASELTQRQIGMRLGVSQMRVSRLPRRAHDHLRAPEDRAAAER